MIKDISTLSFNYKSIMDEFTIFIQEELLKIQPGEVYGIKGYNSNSMEYIWEILNSEYPSISPYILDSELCDDQKYISVSKFFPLLQNKNKAFLILIPSPVISVVENIIGIKEMDELFSWDLQTQTFTKLLAKAPEDYYKIIKEDILNCLDYIKPNPLDIYCTINYLIALHTYGFNAKNIGNFIFLLGLIPDEDLIRDHNTIRQRLDINLKSIHVLCASEKTIYDRISFLPARQDVLQRDLISLVSNHKEDIQNLSKIIFTTYPALNFSKWRMPEDVDSISLPTEHITPHYDILIGSNSPTNQFGIIGESYRGGKIAIDLSGTNTISLFGVQGGGKSYTIGTISEMVLKQFSHVSELPSPLAGVIFHYSESMEYEPEFTSMIYPNDQDRELKKLKKVYGADPGNIEDVIILCPKDKLLEKREEYPSIEILPIAFNPKELKVQDWMFMLGAVGTDANYVKQLKAIAKSHRKNLNLDAIRRDVESSILFTEFEKGLALQKIDFAAEYIDDTFYLKDIVKPGRLIIVDLRDEFIDKDEALGLFVIILNIFSGIKEVDGNHFNKFIVFDEAHKYMDNKELTSNIVTTIREMRHKGVNILIASQDPPSLPNEIIELSSVVLLHKFNSPKWLDHIKYSLTQLEILSPQDMNVLNPGDGYLWATKATEKGITFKPLKISTRPRVTKHGGATLQAIQKKH
ncbi:ATP-binding protein [Aquimarina sp. RZ0]|uniref:ATP-binding protein n=1 Tax=Aquimarina sp. RZ0 TaxID=2607730 RepID=UPI00165EFE58|nr:ATP-binding protein [Aquimarina sp. RZ0]